MIEVEYAKGLAAKLRNGRLIEPSRILHIEGLGDVGTGEVREMAHPDALAAANTIDRLILMIGQAEDAMRERCAKVAANWCGTKEAQGVKDATASAIRIATAIRGIDAGGEG